MATAAGGGDGSVTPGSVTDFAKAVRELIKALHDIGGLVSNAVDLYDRRKTRTAAKSLARLGFPKSGMLAPLGRLADGSGSLEDIESIAQQLMNTAGGVERSIGALYEYHDRLRERFGMAMFMKMNDIVYGPVGKGMIRDRLQCIVSIGRGQQPNMQHIQGEAKYIFHLIEDLNTQLIEMHDLVLPPKQKVPTKSKKKTP